MVIPYRAAKFKSANIFAKAIWGQLPNLIPTNIFAKAIWGQPPNLIPTNIYTVATCFYLRS